MSLPEKAYDRLHCLCKRWELSQEDVYYAIENGLLRVCIRMPHRYMERGVIRNKKFLYIECEHKTGLIRLRPEDFPLVCSSGCADLRIFHSVRHEGHIMRIAYEPPQPPISVHLHDLVVLRQDQLAFEQAYGIAAAGATHSQKKITQPEFFASDNYHHLTLNGKEYHLGDVQANIVRQLYDVTRGRNQWVHGKTLLHGANSKALRLRDIFRRNDGWQKLIVSDGRGYYRLNILELMQPEAKAA